MCYFTVAARADPLLAEPEVHVTASFAGKGGWHHQPEIALTERIWLAFLSLFSFFFLVFLVFLMFFVLPLLVVVLLFLQVVVVVVVAFAVCQMLRRQWRQPQAEARALEVFWRNTKRWSDAWGGQFSVLAIPGQKKQILAGGWILELDKLDTFLTFEHSGLEMILCCIARFVSFSSGLLVAWFFACQGGASKLEAQLFCVVASEV